MIENGSTIVQAENEGVVRFEGRGVGQEQSWGLAARFDALPRRVVK
jgi:hypothetical protein